MSNLAQTTFFNERDIFDAVAFERTLAKSDNPLIPFRTALKNGDETLKALFYQGILASELVPARAWLIDQLLLRAWRRFFAQGNPDLALVAVGGYGRGELHPGSDVDILILTASDDIEPYRSALEDFLAFLWDMGLEIGQSVRTAEQCQQEGTADVTVVTSLMEARLLLGPAPLFERMRKLTGPDHVWSAPEFFHAKHDEQYRRYRKYHQTAYNLEPNVKEGPGGLRDLQTVAWVAKRHFGATTLHDLVDHDFLKEWEYNDLLQCQNFLWQVRFALHALTGRREDRLLFGYQQQLARQFGYQDQSDNLAVEQFMQRYYRTIMELSRLNEMLLQLFKEAILLTDDPGEPIPINRRFQARRGFLEVTRPDVFIRYPFALLEVFLMLQQHPELNGIRASTIRLIRDHRHLINRKFRNDIRAQSLFIKIFRQPRGLTQQLRRMSHYGILALYLPEFGQIVGRMQYDLFHVYTVDQHILFVVRNLRRFYVPEHTDEFPQCSAIIRRLPRPYLLYMAGLYHDIAKGRGGDHSLLGAQDAKQFCRRHGLSTVDSNLVAWLVQHHLTMSLTCQKKDIHDPVVINEFARLVGDQRHLDCLYVLTVADIRATNPKLWNAWRAALLWQLYESTRRALRRGLENPIDKEECIREAQVHAHAQLLQHGISSARIWALWEGFGDDYFLRHTSEEIVWHSRAILQKTDDQQSLVLIRQDRERGGTCIFIFARDRDNLFALIASVLDCLALNVVDARVITGRCGYALDSFTVLEDSGELIDDPERIDEIVTTLQRQLDRPDATPRHPNRRVPGVLKHFPTPTQVYFAEDESNNRTAVELITADRPGLLYRIGQAFTECGIHVKTAKIATIGARAEDVFFITNRNYQPLGNEFEYTRLREILVNCLDEATG